VSAIEFADLNFGGRPVRIEHRWLARERSDRPLIVFLHEGLGSASMWRDFPDALCAATQARGLVYSRPGYGASSPRPAGQRWGVDFMHAQAHELLPALLRTLRVTEPPWLFGHSDGASIALLYAARHTVAGLVLLAPHIRVEEFGLASIRKARQSYLEGDLRQRLARQHADVDSAFWGWNDVWLDPQFVHWNIEAELAHIGCPLLAIQGLDDEYGTLEQIHGIARQVPQAQLLELADCGHSPQRDQSRAVIEATARFIAAARH